MSLPSLERELEEFYRRLPEWERRHPGKAVLIKCGDVEKPYYSVHSNQLQAFNFGMALYKFEPFLVMPIPRAEMDPASYALRSELIRTQ